MSMPSYWFDPMAGGGGGGVLGGNAAAGIPAMSADQINASMWGRYSPGQAQDTLNNIYGSQGFGGLTNQYSAAGAAYGRQTGGFAPENVGGVEAGKWNTMTPQEKLAHNQAVGRNEISFNVGNVPAEKWNTMTPQEKFDHNNAVKRDQGIAPSQFGWGSYGIGSDAVAAPMGSTFDQSRYNPFSLNPNAMGAPPTTFSPRDSLSNWTAARRTRGSFVPDYDTNGGSRSYWDQSVPAGTVTRGRNLAPAGPGDPYFMNSNPAGFNPSLQGGIGSDMRYGGQNPAVPRPNFNDMWQGPPPQVPVSPGTVTVPQQQGSLNWLNGSPPATS